MDGVNTSGQCKSPPTIHHNRFTQCGDGTRVSSTLDELTTISTRSATQTLIFNTLQENFFSLLS